MASIEDLAETIASDLALTRVEAIQILRVVSRSIVQTLAAGETVAINGVGRFKPHVVSNGGDTADIALTFHGKPGETIERRADPYLPKSAALIAVDTYILNQEGKSHLERWRHMSAQSSKDWEKRAKAAAACVIGETVADIGCGAMLVERHLPAGVHYMPYDIVARDERTGVLDLNEEEVPDIQVDTVLLLGVLEYIMDPDRVLRALIGKARRLVISFYKRIENGDAEDLFMIWVRKTSFEGFEEMLVRTGWRIVERVELGSASNRLWVAEPAVQNTP